MFPSNILRFQQCFSLRQVLLSSIFLVSVLVSLTFSSSSDPPIRIYADQFGYFSNIPKVAVISFEKSYRGEIDLNSYVVRNLEDNSIIYQGNPAIWNEGAIHLQSGDRTAWFDFFFSYIIRAVHHRRLTLRDYVRTFFYFK